MFALLQHQYGFVFDNVMYVCKLCCVVSFLRSIISTYHTIAFAVIFNHGFNEISWLHVLNVRFVSRTEWMLPQ